MDSQDSALSEQKNSAPSQEASTTEQLRDEQGRFTTKLYRDSTEDELRVLPLKRYFGFDSADPLHDVKLNDILEELKDHGIVEDGDIVEKIKEIELKLGKDPYENNGRPAKILTYLKLSRDVMQKAKQLQAMEWGGFDKK